MFGKSGLLLALAFWAAPSFAQTIEIDGRTIRLNPKPDLPYWRDPIDSTRAMQNRDLVDQIDLTESQSAVKDQGSRGSCAYFTTIALFEHALKRGMPDRREMNLSEEYLIYANKALDGINGSVDDSYLAANIKTFLARGFLPEDQMPYSHSWFDRGMPCEKFPDDATAPPFCRSHFVPEAAVLERVVPAEKYEFQVDRLTSMIEIINRLIQGQAVTVSVPVNQKGWAGDGGLVTHSEELEAECATNPKICGGHTVLLTGFDLSEGVFYFKNSWGKTWGLSGYGRMPFEYLQKWSYGEFRTSELRRFDSDFVEATVPGELKPVQMQTRRGLNAEGLPGTFVSLHFEYAAPIGHYFYVSVFPQLKEPPVDPLSTAEPSYAPLSFTAEDGKVKNVSDRRFIYIRTADDLIYGPEKPFELFVPDAEIEKAGALGNPLLYLRTSIYRMSDTESYQVLFRTYEPMLPIN